MPETEPNLSTHSLEPQRRLLLHSVRDLLSLESSLRRATPRLSPDRLNERLLLLSRLAASMLSGDPWPSSMPTPAQLACEIWRVRIDAVLTVPQLRSVARSKIDVGG